MTLWWKAITRPAPFYQKKSSKRWVCQSWWTYRRVRSKITFSFSKKVLIAHKGSISMNVLYCDDVLHFFPSYSDFKDCRWILIAGCIFNNFSAYTAIMLNIVTLYAVRKSSSVPKTLRTLMLSLAVSDVCVGVFIQPLYTSFLVTWLQMNNPSCSIYYLMAGVIRTLVNVSLLSVVAIGVDRFLAIHLHLRYKELVTHRRVVAVVMSIWVFCTFFSLTMFWFPVGTVPMINAVISTIGFLLSILINIRIHFIVRRHKFQIQSLQLQEVSQCSEVKRLAVSLKSAGCILYVYLIFSVLYLPLLSSILAIKINGPNSTIRSLNVLALILVFLNSTLNPLIYCWKMRHIRHSVINILRKMPWKRNRTLNYWIMQSVVMLRWDRPYCLTNKG